jgi:hypothetical protein
MLEEAKAIAIAYFQEKYTGAKFTKRTIHLSVSLALKRAVELTEPRLPANATYGFSVFNQGGAIVARQITQTQSKDWQRR